MNFKVFIFLVLSGLGGYTFWNFYCEAKLTAPSVTDVRDVWVRESVGPNAAGFATIVSDADMSLVDVEVLGDPVSKSIELHTHIHEGDVMKMQRVFQFDLRKGQSFSLKPGGDHIMFMGLVRELKEGDSPLKLRFKFKGKDQNEKYIDVDAFIQKSKQ